MITTIASVLLATQTMGHTVQYRIGNEPFEGYAAKGKNAKPNSPVIYVIQDWDGINAHEIGVVEGLAAAGYTAFAIDIYGRDHRPTDMKGNSVEAGKYYSNPKLYMERIKDGLKAFPTKGKKVFIGYCFGGTGVLEVARRNMGAVGVVAFHGGLNPLDKNLKVTKINSEVLVLNGDADPSSPPATRDALAAEFKVAKSFKQINYKDAVHAFTNKSAVGRYQEKADKESWVEMMGFLKRYGR
jgi:dienelactone hydrolase